MNSIKSSDGQAYNILNHTTLDDSRLAATMSINDRSLHRAVGHQVEPRIKSASDSHHLVDEHRRMNRVKYDRWKYQVRRGYNLVNNLDEVLHPSMVGPQPEWTQLIPESKEEVPSLPSDTLSVVSDVSMVKSPIEKITPQIQSFQSPSPLIPKPQPQSQPQPEPAQYKKKESEIQSRVQVKDTESHHEVRSVVSRQSVTPVPSLNLSIAEVAPSPVSYQEPTQGPPGLPVPIVRTGGW